MFSISRRQRKHNNPLTELEQTIKYNEEKDPNFYTAPKPLQTGIQAGRQSAAQIIPNLIGLRHSRKLQRQLAESYISAVKTLQGK